MKVWETCSDCHESGRKTCRECECDQGACTACDGIGFVLISRAKHEYFNSPAFARDAKIFRKELLGAFSKPILANEFAKVLRV